MAIRTVKPAKKSPGDPPQGRPQGARPNTNIDVMDEFWVALTRTLNTLSDIGEIMIQQLREEDS